MNEISPGGLSPYFSGQLEKIPAGPLGSEQQTPLPSDTFERLCHHNNGHAEAPHGGITPATQPSIKPEDPKTEEIPPPLLPVPDTRQAFDYTCGASSLQAVLMYYGEEYLESDLMKMLGTTQNGTTPQDIVRVARELGFDVEMKENMTVDDLAKLTREKVPVIVDGQAWREGEDLKKPWSEVWESGHYMVAVGVGEKNVYLEDPSILGSKGIIPRGEFEERWHDYDDRKYYNLGIIIKGKKPMPPPPFISVLSA
ncbi:MAG: cysteine peptidase family C39 domain-containing protein [Candidatus Eremiobacteraeota bacterium]|nr:cysteine peptidase family C39 domain-containing protein [Candidatus Eremiobacteraeota bacterium]